MPDSKFNQKNYAWLWALLIALILIGGGFLAYRAWQKELQNNQTSTLTLNPAQSNKFDLNKEDWQIDNSIVRKNTTSSDTHKISENLYRMFFTDKDKIMYAESNDCKNFDASIATGIKEEADKMISNPSVLQISDTKWIMIYEMAPINKSALKDAPPGTANQRNLYLANSEDGRSFTAAGVAIDSSKEDNYFASVPDLVKTPDGKIRMYYVSGGEAIGSALSSDEGKTWQRETGFRLTNMAVDPDVVLQTSGDKTKWVMYYSNLDPQKNAIYRATSNDGLTWDNETKLFSATTKGAVVDPDVVEISPIKFVMFLGQSTSGGSTGGEEINLYRATYTGNIFK